MYSPRLHSRRARAGVRVERARRAALEGSESTVRQVRAARALRRAGGVGRVELPAEARFCARWHRLRATPAALDAVCVRARARGEGRGVSD